jgi:hypothetical protein
MLTEAQGNSEAECINSRRHKPNIRYAPTSGHPFKAALPLAGVKPALSGVRCRG